MIKKAFILALVLLLTICCNSGTYDNDPKSWEKVFGEDSPKEIEVIQSRFWKSAHWSYEFEFYCEMNATKDFLTYYFIDHFKLKSQKEKVVFYSDNKPNWFINNIENYEVWEKEHSITLYLNKESSKAYLHCIQF